MIVGHEAARTALEGDLAPVTLLYGPRSIGKWTLTHHLADHHGIVAADRFSAPDGVNMETARRLVTFAHRAAFGAFKLVMVNLDDTAPQAQQALLKTLEEPPGTTRFILTAARLPLGTVVSRCVVFRLGLLTAGQLETVLTAQGLTPAAARAAALAGHGQVDAALHAHRGGDATRAEVLAVAKAIATGDVAGYEKAVRGFSDASAALLNVFLREAITGRWAAFVEADTYGLHRQPERLLGMATALAQLSAAAPRLGVRAALHPYVAGP